MWNEFKTFISRGSVMDLAVGVIIGAAFGKIVDSLVKDVIMPPIGLLLGHIDFKNWFVSLSGGTYATLEEAQKAKAVTMNVGAFINEVITFLIVAFAVFLVVKAYNRTKKAPPPPPPASEKPCPYCRMQIPLEATRCGHCTSQLG
ncbi:MAG TPA: large conductance mechanosensitive channel protein MscL [Candidatus Kapabacteria bacterium]|nr:large conductance mechanosensitive channel protein MscL [Candidatus Kapabacteria bacterium]